MADPTRLPDPDSCGRCGIPQRRHYTQCGLDGSHKWTTPTDRQRLERMKARRAARIAAKEPKPYMPPDPTLVVTLTAVDEATPIFARILRMIDGWRDRFTLDRWADDGGAP